VIDGEKTLDRIRLPDLLAILGDISKKDTTIAEHWEKRELDPHRSWILQTLLVVGRMHCVRQVLRNEDMIGIVGVHNAGKSTLIQNMWGFDTNPNYLIRTEEAHVYRLGDFLWEGKNQRDFSPYLVGIVTMTSLSTVNFYMP
jgi:hypothetical protein